MSGLDYLLSKTQSNHSSQIDPDLPENFSSALSDFISFCEKQLPSVLELDFKPVCFDISKDEENLIIGGEHGNLAVYHVPSRYKPKDEEICGEYAVISVLFTLNEKQIVLSSSKAEIFFLNYPNLRVLGRLELGYTPIPLYLDSRVVLNVVMKLGGNEEVLYYCKFDEKVEIVKLSSDKGYYAKKVESVTVQTTSKVICLDVTEDSTLLAVGCEDCRVTLIHNDTENSLQSTDSYSSKPTILTFGFRKKLLAAGFDDNSLRVWNLDSSLSLKYSFSKHSDVITGLAFVKENRYLITSSFDSSIIIWDMKVESLPYSLNIHNTPVLSFKSSRDTKKVYFCQSKNSVMVWEIPILHKNARYRKHSGAVKKLIFLPNGFELISIGDDGQAVIWDFRNDLMQDSIVLEGCLVNATVPNDGECVMIASTKPCIYKWDFKTGCVDEFEFNSAALAIEFSSDNFNLAVSDTLSRVIVYDADVMERKFILKGHRAPVTALAFIEDDNFLLSASADTEIGKWDLTTGERVAIFKGHKNPITCMTVSSDKLVMSASDEAINAWNFQGVHVYTMQIPLTDSGRIISLYISNNNSYLLALQENQVSFWQLDNLSIIFLLDTMYSGQHITLSKDERFVAIAEGSTVFIEENPMHATDTRIVGKSQGSKHKYMKFVIDSQKKEAAVTHKSSYNHWVVVPYLIGISHILAFSNRIESLNDALNDSENKAGFFSTVNDENPLTLAVDLEYKNIIDVCLKYMRGELAKKNIRALASIGKCLTQLNSIEYPDIAKVYDMIFIQADDLHLPAFCLHEAELPVLYTSEHLTVLPEEIMSKEYFSSTGRPVVFHHSLCLLDMELGTSSSLEFLQSLLNGDSNVYSSKIIKEFLTCKWEKITLAVNIQGCLYILYMVLLSIYTVNFMRDLNFFMLVFLSHLSLFSIEVLQLATDYRNYFFDVWNVIDLLRTWSFFFYMYHVAILDVFSYDYLFAVIVFSWLRGISYFRMFDGTRYMVRLLGMVILDMRVFFTILAYSTVGFAFIFYLRNPETPFFIYLMTSYRLDLGDFNTDYTVVFDWIVFFFATMLNPMILLNLLISILSDTAANVSKDNYVANLQELTRMIIEVEKVMFWKKDVQKKHFLHLCNFIEDGPQPDKIIERCKFIKYKMDKMQKTLDLVNHQIKGICSSSVENRIKYMVEEQDGFREEVNLVLKRNNRILEKIGERLGSSV
jgi:WD40 repeat protein